MRHKPDSSFEPDVLATDPRPGQKAPVKLGSLALTPSVRLVAATVLSPCVAPILAFVLYPVPPSNGAFGWILVSSLVFAYAGLITLGLPLVWLLGRLKRLNIVSIALSGAVAGVVLFYGFLMLLSLPQPLPLKPFGIGGVVLGAGFGFGIALTFALIGGLTLRSTGCRATCVRSAERPWPGAG
jgi:hypothetical protein